MAVTPSSPSPKFSPVEYKKFMEITSDPVKWAQVFVKTADPSTKRIVPWVARWYQVEMLRDNTTKKVYRCGRRTGKLFCPYATN
jgi:hypothetical protein